MAKIKLTAAQKHEIYDRYVAGGTTYARLAKEYGVSIKGIAKTVCDITAGKAVRGTDTILSPHQIANAMYPAIEKWRQRNRLTLEEMAVRCGLGLSTLRGAIYRTDRSLRAPNGGPCQNTIEAILRVTGLTYEEAFRRADVKKGSEK